METLRKYNYIARAKDGSIQRGEIEASDRNDALRRLKGQGVTPLGITDPKPQAAVRSSVGLTRREMAIVVLGLIVIVGFFGYRLMGDGKPGKAKHGERTVAAATQVNQRPQLGGIQMPDLDAFPIAATAGVVAPPATVAKTVAPVVPVRVTVSPAQPPPRRERKVRQYIPPGGTNSVPPMFKTQTEQVLAYFATAKLGDMPPPPLPEIYSREDIAKILDTDIVVYDTDDDNVNEIKVDVAQAKSFLKKFIADGGSMKEFIDYYQEEMAKAYREREAAQSYMMELINAGDEAGALAYFEEQNAAFTAKGIKPLQFPRILQPQ